MSEKSFDKKEDSSNAKKNPSKLHARKLDKFLASICKAGGMTGGPLSNFLSGGRGAAERKEKPTRSSESRFECQGPCAEAEWRAHLDIPEGLLCLSAAWSRNPRSPRHRDVTIGVNYLDDRGRPQYEEMTFCDSEVRWIMETLWHAPIWD